MNLADLSIKRPVFITALLTALMSVGLLSLRNMPVDLFPDLTLPIVAVTTIYPGAGPEEVETLVSKVIEDQLSTVTGIKTLRSENTEGVSTVIAEFTSETDLNYAEQQVRDKVSMIRRQLPSDIEEPIIQRIDPSDSPILILGLRAPSLTDAQLFDLADDYVRPKIEQVNQVGKVTVAGGREREIHIELDRRKLEEYELSATAVVQKLAATGVTIPAGKINEGKNETTFRTIGEFENIDAIGSTVVSFFGNDIPVTVNDIGKVRDTVKDETNRAYSNGNRMIFLVVYRQSKANTIAVADAVKKRVEEINAEFKAQNSDAQFIVLRDGSKMIRANVDDVYESIIIGIILTVIVVYFFLGSGRSTIITGLSLPTSLIGAFFLMSLAGFTVNIMTLLALSIAVGLLIDDAIVVRENIFRHVEMGKHPIQAASDGTKEVLLAVIATTFAIISVFGPIGFLKGIVGQMFRQFGLSVCFAMMISLFDAITTAPMLSAYFAAGGDHGPHKSRKGLWGKIAGPMLAGFDRFQTWLEHIYEKVLHVVLRHPFITIGSALGIFIISLGVARFIPMTFIPATDTGEFIVQLETTPGTNLEEMSRISLEIDEAIRNNKEVKNSTLIVGGFTGESNTAQIFVELVPAKERNVNTSQFKAMLREQLKAFPHASPIVTDIGIFGGSQRAFTVNILGNDLNRIQEVVQQLYDRMKDHPALTDVDVSFRPGKPEFQVVPDKKKAERLGVLTSAIGSELRTLVEGSTPAVYREKGQEYKIRVRLQEDQRNLREQFDHIYVPNVNGRQVRLRDVAKAVDAIGPTKVTRQDRGRYYALEADINPKGPGMASAMAEVKRLLESEIKMDPDMRYKFVGQAESFQELQESMFIALTLGILFIYLVLGSLYESFVTPFTIMLVLPLAICGALFALLISDEPMSLFSMIGIVLLLGVATKNSILLVDYTNQLLAKGLDFKEAVIRAGVVRLRPILMTSIALIAGMIPIAIGLNEASRQRTSLGIAVIGGVISSTLLTLVVVPAAFSYIERFRRWCLRWARRLAGLPEHDDFDLDQLNSNPEASKIRDEEKIRPTASMN